MAAIADGTGNVSATHRFGRRQAAAVDEAREHVLAMVGGPPGGACSRPARPNPTTRRCKDRGRGAGRFGRRGCRAAHCRRFRHLQGWTRSDARSARIASAPGLVHMYRLVASRRKQARGYPASSPALQYLGCRAAVKAAAPGVVCCRRTKMRRAGTVDGATLNWASIACPSGNLRR